VHAARRGAVHPGGERGTRRSVYDQRRDDLPHDDPLHPDDAVDRVPQVSASPAAAGRHRQPVKQRPCRRLNAKLHETSSAGIPRNLFSRVILVKSSRGSSRGKWSRGI